MKNIITILNGFIIGLSVHFFTVQLIHAQTSSKITSAPYELITQLSEGDQMPSSVWNKIPKKKTTELVIIDFWITGCTSCM